MVLSINSCEINKVVRFYYFLNILNILMDIIDQTLFNDICTEYLIWDITISEEFLRLSSIFSYNIIKRSD